MLPHWLSAARDLDRTAEDGGNRSYGRFVMGITSVRTALV
jgi:hypothetical protein